MCMKKVDTEKIFFDKMTGFELWHFLKPGTVARSEACPFGMQAALSSIPTVGTFFHGDLVMKKVSMAILPLLLIQEEQLSVTGERMCTKYW